MKQHRHELILQAIAANPVSTQEKLRQYLAERGVAATQATMSRDIRDLRLVKAPAAGGLSCYQLPTEDADGLARKYRSILQNSIISADAVGNFLCVRCFTGMAQGACAALDAMQWIDVVGTLGGEDTIFVLCRTEQAALTAREEILHYAAKFDH
ncbi:MAG: arginine repressor [Oscillospiraceae bacterium]|jgi:transcriptional regulator of arginine metabolism|nr:arginine repressor [Oscillospiraceae bacterium]